MIPPDGYHVDHINGDKSDNRRRNLRICTPSENSCNGARIDSKSGVRGVYWQEKRQRYQVQITKDGITYSLGRFIDLDEAISVRLAAEDKHHGDFAFNKREAIIDERSKASS